MHPPAIWPVSLMTTAMTLTGARAADVQFQLVPLPSPTVADASFSAPPSPVVQVSPDTSLVLEVWVSDLAPLDPQGHDGVVIAYVDLLYDPAWLGVTSFVHSSAFPSFLGTQPVLNTAAGQVLNFGGAAAKLNEPRGIAPEWTRIGWIEMTTGNPSSPVLVSFAGRGGLGGVGCFGRTCGETEFVGTSVTILPDPPGATIMLIGLAVVVMSWSSRQRPRGTLRDLQTWHSGSVGIAEQRRSDGTSPVVFGMSGRQRPAGQFCGKDGAANQPSDIWAERGRL